MPPKRSKVVVTSAKDAALAALRLAKESSDVFPPLKGLCGAIVFITDVTDTFYTNKKEWGELTLYIAELVKDLAVTVGQNRSANMERDIRHLNSELEAIQAMVDKLASRSLISRVTQSKADLMKINQCRAMMDTAMLRFNAISAASLRRDLENLRLSTAGAPTEAIDFQVLTPRRPYIFHGRDEELGLSLSMIREGKERGDPARAIIRGGGGLGKTTLALTIFHHDDIQKLFEDRRFFVPCESTYTSAAVISAIIQALRLPQGESNPLQQVRNFLLASNEAIFIILDNFETPWFGENQEDVRQLLLMLDPFSHLTLLLTTRGNVLPKGIQWTKPIFPPLLPFTLKAAQATFADIAGSEHLSPELDVLLEALGRVPLAVDLMANLALSGYSVADLQRAWDKEKTAILTSDGASKHTNIEISIKISIDSRPIQSDPSVLRLLAVLCHLPDGAAKEHIDQLVMLKKPESAAAILKAVSLIYEDQSRLKVLSPIRGFILSRADERHVLHPEDKEALFQYYTELTMKADCWPGDNKFLLACQILPTERGNIHSIMSLAITESMPSSKEASAIWVYGKFLQLTAPSLELLDQILKNHRWTGSRTLEPELLAKLMVQLGSTCTTMGNYERGINQLEKAQTFATNHHVPFQAAVALRDIGTTYRHQGEYDKSLDALLRAQEEFITLGTERAIDLSLDCRLA